MKGERDMYRGKTVTQAINDAKQYLGRVTYTQDDRRGSFPYFDCSSFMGFIWGVNRFTDTDSMIGDFTAAGFQHISYPDYPNTANLRKGDVVVRPKSKGKGHTGMYIGGNNIIHCTVADGGVVVWNFDYRTYAPFTDILRSNNDGIFLVRWIKQ